MQVTRQATPIQQHKNAADQRYEQDHTITIKDNKTGLEIQYPLTERQADVLHSLISGMVLMRTAMDGPDALEAFR